MFHTNYRFYPARLSFVVALALCTPSLYGQVIAGSASESAQAETVSELTVTAQKPEQSRSYTINHTSTATRLNLSLRETPQTVTVVTRQKMDDFGLTSIDEVLESTSGVYVFNRGANGIEPYSRGFEMQSQYDGIPNPIGISESNRASSPDSAFFDKVEILQGASGLLSGAGDPGGTINLVYKRPTWEFQSHLEAELGSWRKKRLVGDVSGALLKSGQIRARAVALIDHSDSFTDYVYDNRKGIYGVVDADVTPTTTLSASITHQNNDYNMHYGIPRSPNGADLRLPRSSFYGFDTGYVKESTIYILRLNQELPEEWLLKAAWTHNETTGEGDVNGWLSGILNPVTGNGLSLNYSSLQRKMHSDAFDIYTSGPVRMFGRWHELVFGISDVQMKIRSRNSKMYSFPVASIYNFDQSSVPRPTAPLQKWSDGSVEKTVQKGIYGVARLTITNSARFIIGGRISWFESSLSDLSDLSEEKTKANGVVSPYGGLTYDLNDTTSVYASYSDIFNPQSELKAGGGTLPPVVGRNYEIGIKGELMQGQLNTQAAVFRLAQSNLAKIDLDAAYAGITCNGGNCFRASGLVVSQGLDLALNGTVLPGWQVSAGYTYVHSREKMPAGQWQPYGTNTTPRHILRVYTTYHIPDTRWTIGANIRSQSKIYQARGSGYYAEQGGYTVVGLMARYQISKQAEAGITINNLFDRHYYENTGHSGNFYNFYGAPRHFAVNLKYKF